MSPTSRPPPIPLHRRRPATSSTWPGATTTSSRISRWTFSSPLQGKALSSLGVITPRLTGNIGGNSADAASSCPTPAEARIRKDAPACTRRTSTRQEPDSEPSSSRGSSTICPATTPKRQSAEQLQDGRIPAGTWNIAFFNLPVDVFDGTTFQSESLVDLLGYDGTTFGQTPRPTRTLSAQASPRVIVPPFVTPTGTAGDELLQRRG